MMLEDSKVQNKWVPCRHPCSGADSRIIVLCNAGGYSMRIVKEKRTSVTHIHPLTILCIEFFAL